MTQKRLSRISNKYRNMQILGVIVCLLGVGCSGGVENISQPNAPTSQPSAQAISTTPSPTPTTSRPISTANTAAVPTMAAPAATSTPPPVTALATPVATTTPPPAVVTPVSAPTATSIPTPAATLTPIPTATAPPVVASSGSNSSSDIPFMVYGTGANSGDTVFVLVANNVIEIVTADSQGNWGPVLAVGKKGELITFLLNGNVVNQSAEWTAGGTPQNVQTGLVLTLKQ